ncbi:YhcH/YjgK/YiaL family protein [Shewanella atlantica]|uniref:DUF386 family protein n=1 Tax=Shewanella atlantica TaxID=271099 RepID=A0A431WAN8_9GAMM|nr:YhcH/YjgK/YiaL family protein [Shewanella atlantica]RTR32531.1 DUF386 family protein [Shewanella atlantica]
MLNQPKSLTEFLTSCPDELKSAIEYAVGSYVHLKDGRFDIPDSNVFGVKLNYSLKPYQLDDVLTYENHRKLIDLHIILEGEEMFSQLDDVQGELLSEYNKKDDYELIYSSQINSFSIESNNCILFNVGVWHTTGIKNKCDSVKKIVLKIPLDIFTK